MSQPNNAVPGMGSSSPDADETKQTTTDQNPPTAADDDRPQREDEYLGDMLQSPSPEGDAGDARNDEKGVVPGKKRDQ